MDENDFKGFVPEILAPAPAIIARGRKHREDGTQQSDAAAEHDAGLTLEISRSCPLTKQEIAPNVTDSAENGAAAAPAEARASSFIPLRHQEVEVRFLMLANVSSQGQM